MLSKLGDYLKWTTLTVAGLYLIAYIVLAVIRLSYPFELEWIEGAAVDHCRWLLAGNELYSLPTTDFVALNYPPFYYYVAALAMKLFGIGFFAPRLVSFISSLACFFLIYAIVKYETKKFIPAFLSASMYAAAYKFTGAWYDLARADSLQMLLILFSVYSVRRLKDIKGLIIAALALVLAFYTKQSTIIIVIALGGYLLFYHRKAFITYSLFWLSITAGIMLFLILKSDGWYYYYTFLIPGQHEVAKSFIISFWFDSFLKWLSPALIIIAAHSIFRSIISPDYSKVEDPDPIGDEFAFYTMLSGGLVLMAFVVMIHPVAYLNNLMPLVAGISILSGIAFWRLIIAAGNSHQWAVIIWIVMLLQFGQLFYFPHYQIPSQNDRKAGERLISLIKGIDGPVFVCDHGFYSVMANKASFAHRMAVKDVLDAKSVEFKGIRPSDILKNDIIDDIRSKRFAAIIMDFAHGEPYDDELVSQYYDFKGDIFGSPKQFFPVTGMQTRPQLIYVIKK